MKPSKGLSIRQVFKIVLPRIGFLLHTYAEIGSSKISILYKTSYKIPKIDGREKQEEEFFVLKIVNAFVILYKGRERFSGYNHKSQGDCHYFNGREK